MPISLRAAALRTALERALTEPVHLLRTDDGVRLHALAPPPDEVERWKAAFDALRTADRWGGSCTPQGPEVWAEIKDEVST
jgi:hypothetical protein